MGTERDLVLLSSLSSGVTAKASSVLQKNVKLYGPMNALDLESSTSCWNSDGRRSGKHFSHYILDFGRVVQPVELRIQFQAGFIAEKLEILSHQQDSTWLPMIELEVNDDHDLQVFSLESSVSSFGGTNALKLVFDDCTDFYGRVTVYQLQIWGFESTTKS